jgi:uncharacterized membrane protein YjgN (DUF898 family)
MEPVRVRRELPFEFRATGSEYFRIWIVNLLLTVVTIGIYSAWAKVRRMRYFHGNTFVDGTSFEYHGKPEAILKGRLIAFGLYAVLGAISQLLPIVYLVMLPVLSFGVPWIIMRSRTFQMRNTSYRGIRFNFHGTYRDALIAFIGWGLASLISLYLLVPVFLRKRVAYILDNTAFGRERFRVTLSNGVFFRFCYITAALFIVVLLAFPLLLGASGAFSSILADPSSVRTDPTVALTQLGSGAFLIILLLIAASLVVFAYYQKSYGNAVFNGLEIGPIRVRSNMQTLPLAWINVSNFLGIIFTLGLFYPWAMVRQLRYRLDHLRLDVSGSLDAFTAVAAGETPDAVGEEIGDFFDVDFGI